MIEDREYMKKKQVQELRAKTTEDLQAELTVRQKEAVVARMDLALGMAKNSRAVRAARRNIAQIKTLIREEKS